MIYVHVHIDSADLPYRCCSRSCCSDTTYVLYDARRRRAIFTRSAISLYSTSPARYKTLDYQDNRGPTVPVVRSPVLYPGNRYGNAVPHRVGRLRNRGTAICRLTKYYPTDRPRARHVRCYYAHFRSSPQTKKIGVRAVCAFIAHLLFI